MPSASGKDRSDWIACAVLTLLWVGSIPWIGIHGDFPLSDDWAYARTTRTLLETGRFERLSWTWTPIVSHVALGVAAVRLFEFSFPVLRGATLAMGWLGLLGAYALCRQLGTPPRWSALAAATFGANPIYLLLSYTYMTDVPFAAFATWSLVFAARALQRGRAVEWLASALLAAAAILSRQVGLVLPVAVLAAIGLTRARQPRSAVPAALAASAAFLLFALTPRLFFDAGDAHSLFGLRLYLERVCRDPSLLYFLARNLLSCFVYLGVFLGPLVLLAPLPAVRRRSLALGVAVAAALGLGALAAAGLRMPLGVDVVNEAGLGALTLDGSEELPSVSVGFWWAVTALGVAGGAAGLLRIVGLLWEQRAELAERPAALLLALVPALYLAALAARWPFFDRWLLPILPPLAALLVLPLGGTGRAPARAARAAGALALGGLGLCAVLGTRDYLAHHRLRWSLIEAEVIARGIDPDRVDAGFEFSGWFNYPAQHRPGDPPFALIADDEYVVSYRATRPGYRAIASRQRATRLPPRIERLTLFQREEPVLAGGEPQPR